MPRETGDILRPLIRILDGEDACWEWIGKKLRGGYGCKQFGGRTVLAHRWVFQLFHGWLPQHAVLNHLCRNRCCVNPKHLEVTTTAGNVRHGRGTKLTAAQAAEIKMALLTVKWGERILIAERYGVSVGLITDIKYGRAWADIEAA